MQASALTAPKLPLLAGTYRDLASRVAVYLCCLRANGYVGRSKMVRSLRSLATHDDDRLTTWERGLHEFQSI